MDILSKINNLPNKPGCYIYFNNEHKVIYVGKAKNLKKRVQSYFKRVHNIKTTRLVREIADIEYFVVNNEREALLLEENLIKKYRPRFNILLNDDKSYPYIIITNEKDPEYKYVRKYDKKASKSYGPLPIGSSAGQILTILQRAYPLRRCKGNEGKPCFYYHINQCSGACFKEVEAKYYTDQIKQVDKFFKGNTKDIIKSLTSKMNHAAENLQFEEAGRIKDSIKGLTLALATNNVELVDDKNRDVIAYKIEDDKIAISTLFYRAGQLLFKDDQIADYEEQDITEILALYLNQLYSKNMFPDQIIIPNDLDFDYLIDDIKKRVTTPINKIEKAIYDLAYNNAIELLRTNNLKSQIVNDNETKVLELLQEMLKLDIYPNLIEMFDISNIANDFVTGSVVVYRNGKYSRNDCRKYNIEIEQKDDASRLKNMMYRRFQKALVEDRELPDLIIMDGGIIQVRAAKSILDDLNLNFIPVIGLVKDNKHTTDKIFDLNENEIKLDRKTPIYNLLASIQVKVDQYAKAGFRKKQNRSLTSTQLEKIPGLGQKKIQELFKTFNNLIEMKKTNFEQLNKVVKNKNTTNLLIEYLNNNV